MVKPRTYNRPNPGRGSERPSISLGSDGKGTLSARKQMHAEALRIDRDITRGRKDPQVDRNLEIYNQRAASMRKRAAMKKLGAARKKAYYVSPSGKVEEVDI